MKRPIQSLIQAVMLILFMAAGGLLLAAPPSGESDPEVDSASPNFALQGDRKTITISGANFAPGASVRFLVTGTKDSSQIDVISADYLDEFTLEADIQVLDTATVSQYDIEVKVGRRKGKGTTFKVEAGDVSPSECNFDFDAELCDVIVADPYAPPNGCNPTGYLNGLRSDRVEPYPAIGGMGFRLDTNGSMKLEGAHDDRKIVVDFAVHSVCPKGENDPNWDPDHPKVAAGFCMQMKGSDIRIEHQVQEPYGLCVLQPGQSEDQGVVVSFLADDGGTLVDPNRNGKGPEPLRLNYGCRGNQTGTAHYVPGWRATVTRHSEWEWSIVGTTACLETQLGEIWDRLDAEGNPEPIPIQMPFHIHITRVDAPTQ